ncbi:MAG: FKBP-type peptidyl-prolyl cis-trans isomerase [Bacteroidales bacterium]|nr:FKBP-type peptidyl-prolyl cis-trans isomerase [Bacteroidales bacterium]
MKKIVLYSLVISIFLCFACSKMDEYEDAQDKAFENLRKSLLTDSKYLKDSNNNLIDCYDDDGILLALQNVKKDTIHYADTDTVTIIYTGVSMRNNKTFSTNDTIQFIYGNNSLIEGWKIALPHIRKFSTGVLLISYDKAYGKHRAGLIEPYQPLKYTFSTK